jgi:hypothetical protein
MEGTVVAPSLTTGKIQPKSDPVLIGRTFPIMTRIIRDDTTVAPSSHNNVTHKAGATQVQGAYLPFSNRSKD